MDTKSLKTLEFDKVLQILAGFTSFSAGEALALSLHPTTDLWEANQWQSETQEAMVLLDTNTSVTIGGARDVRQAIDNAEHGFTLTADSLLEIRNTIIAARNLKRQLIKAHDNFPKLAAVAELVEECPGIVSSISQTIDDRGEVLDSASPKLGKIRQQQRVTHAKIQDKLQRLLNSSQNQHLQEPLVSTRGGRYVVPLRADAKGRIKGIVHDQSGSGATLWIEPMATVDLNNEYRGLKLEEDDEIGRILAALSEKIADQGDSIKRVVERMAELDLIFAKGRYAAQIDGVTPTFVEWREFEQPKPPKHANELAKWTPPPPNLHPGSTIWIKGARHPLLSPDEVIPTDLTVNEDIFTILITGPNTGGKTVSLKSMGLMVLMAQSGLHLPAIEARMTLFDDVFADIGDEQSIEQSLSTFSGHMTNIIRILDSVDDRSLILFDELGSGTDPTEGAALAQAVINYLRDKGATSFVATHYPELKVYASQTKGATNASLLFDVDTLSPTYEMSIGIPGRSNAFAIARRLGLDNSILDDAMKMVGNDSHEAEDLLDSIYSLREKIAAEEATTRLAMKEAEQNRDALVQRLEEIEDERAEILERTENDLREEIEAVKTELKQIRRQIRDADSLNKLKKANKQLEAVEMPQTAVPIKKPTKPKQQKGRQLKPGDTVKIKTLNTTGEVISINRAKKEAQLAVGRLQMRAKLADLEFKGRPVEEREREYINTTSKSVGMELDIRGKRVEDGLQELEAYIDSAFLSNMPWVRVIHGKGTGKLRKAVRSALGKNRHVKSWEEGKKGEGDAGVTVAKLIEN
ncbi:MAG: Smr/MutS family protein [Chloroflexota bacterium]